MAEVQDRHRRAAEAAFTKNWHSASPLGTQTVEFWATLLADQEAEIANEATRLGRMLIEGKPPGGDWKESDKAAMYAAGKRLLEFGGNVRSGEWRSGGGTACKACGRRSCMCQ